ncbi:MAG: right-handed parallel beta-helix repeat-containing protein [Acidobacteriota bacterium]|nr:MAG: right-handed parallel beta-helix repeat-containing protein [Acidobacteriota bacterium]
MRERSSWKSQLHLVLLLALCLLPGIACQPEGPRTYYLDSVAGDDANSGQSEKAPWKSLDRVNETRFAPGDQILFKADSEYVGRLAPKGSGSLENPIKVSTYGGEGRALIAAEGKFNEALLLQNQEYWEVSNLELTNLGTTREPFRFGVRVRSWDYGTMHHIQLRNLYIHDVNGSLVKKDQGEGHGIVWENGGQEVHSNFDGLLIEDCHLLRTDRNGISGYTEYPTDRSIWVPSLNVVIRNNALEDIGGDGIKPWGCDGALVEHNVVDRGRQRCEDYAAGIWPWNSDNTLIQFNEVSGMKGQKDGQAFDSDAFCRNTVFQYNYSHDNDGGFMLICGRENVGTTIRYNISQNDKTRLFHFYDLINNTRIYNNTFYVKEGIDLRLFIWTPGRSGWATDTEIYNNVFYIDGVGRNHYGLGKKEVDDGVWLSEPGFGGAQNTKFEQNLVFGNFEDVPEEWLALKEDPGLVAPGGGGTGFESLKGYELREDSPGIGAGKPIDDNGGRDFWGNPVSDSGAPSIGAHERPRSE